MPSNADGLLSRTMEQLAGVFGAISRIPSKKSAYSLRSHIYRNEDQSVSMASDISSGQIGQGIFNVIGDLKHLGQLRNLEHLIDLWTNTAEC